MKNKHFLILEKASSKLEISNDNNDVIYLEGVFTEFNVRNRMFVTETTGYMMQATSFQSWRNCAQEWKTTLCLVSWITQATLM